MGVPGKIASVANGLKGTLEAVLMDEKMEQIDRVPVSELAVKLQQVEGAHTLVFDGIITQRIVDIAADKGLKRSWAREFQGLPNARRTFSCSLPMRLLPKKPLPRPPPLREP